jgi:membrane-associated phospholipid phosphatase
VTKTLAALVWLAGIALILGAGALLARRERRAVPARAGRRGAGAGLPSGGGQPVVMDLVRLGVLVAVGAVAVYGVMAALGAAVVHYGPHIDKPVFTWIGTHRVHAWADLMDRFTKIGNTWTTWGACAAAACCLAVTWRARRWLPPVVLAAVIVVDHFTTLALRHTFHRIGPPGSLDGTYPSGGVDRVVLMYGMIAYLLWREFSGRRPAAVWAVTAVAALAFSEAYSRVYLTLHWLTDSVAGLVYGGLLLTVFVAAVRRVTRPASAPAASPPEPVTPAPGVAAPARGGRP